MLALSCVACDEAARVDRDRDGSLAGEDCDDRDPRVLPGAVELCDGIDNDCNGLVDDDPLDVDLWFPDEDEDGFSAAPEGTEGVRGCRPGPAWAVRRGDCADDDPAVHPQAQDVCNGVDDDCDGVTDDEPAGDRWIDADGDGFGHPWRPAFVCDGERIVAQAGDCHDGDPAVFPGAPERCNDFDDDCDGLVDDEDLDSPLADPPTWYPDQDRDGFGVAGVLDLISCLPPNEHWAEVPGDCDDVDPETFPGAVERCHGRDGDCDGVLPDASGWFDVDFGYRVPLTVRAPDGADLVEPVVIVDVDFGAAADEAGWPGSFSGAPLLAVVQTCEIGGRALPVAFSDGLTGLLEPADPTDPLGDEVGSVHFVYDGVIAAGEEVSLALYAAAAPRSEAPGLTADPRGWGGVGADVVIDPDRGGLLDDVLPDGITNVISQADATQGNGLRLADEWLQASSPASALALEAGPVLAAIEVDGTHATARGSFEYRAWWWGYAGHPAIFGKIWWQLHDDVVLVDPFRAGRAARSFQVVAPGLPGVAMDVSADGRWAGWHEGIQGAAFGWVEPPAFALPPICDETGCWLAGAELALDGPSVLVPGGTVLVDHRVLAVMPTGGDPALDDRLDTVLDGPAVEVRAAELRPDLVP